MTHRDDRIRDILEKEIRDAAREVQDRADKELRKKRAKIEREVEAGRPKLTKEIEREVDRELRAVKKQIKADVERDLPAMKEEIAREVEAQLQQEQGAIEQEVDKHVSSFRGEIEKAVQEECAADPKEVQQREAEARFRLHREREIARAVAVERDERIALNLRVKAKMEVEQRVSQRRSELIKERVTAVEAARLEGSSLAYVRDKAWGVRQIAKHQLDAYDWAGLPGAYVEMSGLFREMATTYRTKWSRYGGSWIQWQSGDPMGRLASGLLHLCWCLHDDDADTTVADYQLACRIAAFATAIARVELIFREAYQVFRKRIILVRSTLGGSRAATEDSIADLCKEVCTHCKTATNLAELALDAICDPDKIDEFCKAACKLLIDIEKCHRRLVCLLELIKCSPETEPPLAEVMLRKLAEAGVVFAMAVRIKAGIQVPTIDDYELCEREFVTVKSAMADFEQAIDHYSECHPYGEPKALRGYAHRVAKSAATGASRVMYLRARNGPLVDDDLAKHLTLIDDGMDEIVCIGQKTAGLDMRALNVAYWAIGRLWMKRICPTEPDDCTTLRCRIQKWFELGGLIKENADTEKDCDEILTCGTVPRQPSKAVVPTVTIRGEPVAPAVELLPVVECAPVLQQKVRGWTDYEGVLRKVPTTTAGGKIVTKLIEEARVKRAGLERLCRDYEQSPTRVSTPLRNIDVQIAEAELIDLLQRANYGLEYVAAANPGTAKELLGAQAEIQELTKRETGASFTTKGFVSKGARR